MVGVLDPVILPLFLELGSLVFFAVAFPYGRKVAATEQVAGKREEPVTLSAHRAYTREEALADFQHMRHSPSQQVLAARWQVSEGCVSKWLRSWQSSGAIERQRIGREKAVLLLPAPSR